jgi:hypothetical protein
MVTSDASGDARSIVTATVEESIDRAAALSAAAADGPRRSSRNAFDKLAELAECLVSPLVRGRDLRQLNPKRVPFRVPKVLECRFGKVLV